MHPSFLLFPFDWCFSNFTALWNVQLFYTILKYIEYGLETSTQMINTAAEISFVTLMSNHVKMPADLKTHVSSNFYLKTYPSFQHPLSENTSSTKLPCRPCRSWRSWRLWGMSVPVLDKRREWTTNHLWENLGSIFRVSHIDKSFLDSRDTMGHTSFTFCKAKRHEIPRILTETVLYWNFWSLAGFKCLVDPHVGSC